MNQLITGEISEIGFSGVVKIPAYKRHGSFMVNTYMCYAHVIQVMAWITYSAIYRKQQAPGVLLFEQLQSLFASERSIYLQVNIILVIYKSRNYGIYVTE